MNIDTPISQIIDELINSVLINVEDTEPILQENDIDIDCLIEQTNKLSIFEEVQEIQEVQEVKKLPVSPNKKLFEIISSNSYVKNCLSNKEKDINSLSYLIKQLMSQSDCIKIGHGVEKVILELIAALTKLESIKQKNEKGKKERDHLFENKEDKIIHYAELKSNLNLDTEKSKSTSQKCLDIEQELKEMYPEHTIKMYLVGIRYFDKTIIPQGILKKYSNISENLCGVNDYLRNLGITETFVDEEDYKIFLNELARQMFDNV